MQAVDAGTHEGNKIELLQQRLQIRQLSHMPCIAVYRLRRRVHGARACSGACFLLLRVHARGGAGGVAADVAYVDVDDQLRETGEDACESCALTIGKGEGQGLKGSWAEGKRQDGEGLLDDASVRGLAMTVEEWSRWSVLRAHMRATWCRAYLFAQEDLAARLALCGRE